MPSILLGRSVSRGGNVLGLGADDGNLLNALTTVFWDSAEDDALVEGQVQELFARAAARADELGVAHPYLYLNYAAPWQDPIAGYGDESVAFLRGTSATYDPTGLFQKHVPGGFKLSE